MSDRTKFPRIDAIAVAKELCDALRPHTDRLIVAGSLRRRKDMVGDVEILFIPKFQIVRDGLFDQTQASLADHCLAMLITAGTLAPRKNIKGSITWGPKNKLALHIPSGIPVDFFATNEEAWFNYIVCRTGPAESNMAICNAAIAKGWKWNPYAAGFSRPQGLGTQIYLVKSERDVFDFVGLPFREAWERT